MRRCIVWKDAAIYKPDSDRQILIWHTRALLTHEGPAPGVDIGQYIPDLRLFRPIGGNGNFNSEIPFWAELPGPPIK